MPTRLAIVISHPVQYYSPWFRHLAAQRELCVKVFYLWDFGVKETRDRSFGTSFKWDIPLLDGYDSEFLPNRDKDPGTHHFRGLDNPQAVEAIAAWKPDAVLLFGYGYATHLRLILSPRLAGIPFYFRGDSHELCPANGWKPKVSRKLRGLFFRRFAGFLAVGEANAGYFRASGVARSKIHRVPHCVDNTRFQTAAVQAEIDAIEWKRELGIPAGSTVVLFAGKFEDKKRPLDLLTAFLTAIGLQAPSVPSGHMMIQETRPAPQPSALKPQLSPVLLFVGNGSLEAELRKRAGSELGRSIFFAPFQNQTSMPKVYAAGDLLVLPSHGRGETWGLAVNEAMNLGRPAVVSSHVGCGPDLIVAGKTGWIFPAGNVDALCACLSEALTDRDELRRKGAAARVHVAGFSYEVATQALIAAVTGTSGPIRPPALARSDISLPTSFPVSLIHHQRLPGPTHVSIERLFDEIRRHLPKRWEPEIAVCPNPSRGLIPRLGNMRAARQRAGTINHIVGDVHYLALSLPRNGLVLTIHDCATLSRLQGLAQSVFRQLWFSGPMARAQVVTTISETMRRELRDWLGALADDVRVIPNCVRGEFIPNPKPFNQAAPVILQVGTGWNKNVERVAEALSGTPCRLEIIGTLSESQRNTIRSTGIAFSELGRVSDAEVLAAYQRCDMVVFASLYEGFGLPILEGQATGRPVITSDFGAMAEAAGKGALLVNPQDVRAVREAILGLCGNPALRDELVAAGFENLKGYRADSVAAAYAAVYDECLS